MMFIGSAIVAYVGPTCPLTTSVPPHPLAATSLPPHPVAAHGRNLLPPCCTLSASPRTARVQEHSDVTVFKQIELALESLTGDPVAMLEAVVGLDIPGRTATYDRDSIVQYFQQRPTLMVSRALDFLLAFRRIRVAWEADGVDRGAVLRAELAALGPVAVKVGQTLSQRPDILPEDVCEALKRCLPTRRLTTQPRAVTSPCASPYDVPWGCRPSHPFARSRRPSRCV